MKRFEDGRRLCFALILALFGGEIKAQSIDISNFYYRDYLDFGQNKGVFGSANSSGDSNFGVNSNSNLGSNSANLNGNSNSSSNGANLNANSSINSSGGVNSNGVTLTGKNSTSITIPNTPNFYASSNYGSLTSVGRGFAVTANHVVSFTPEYDSTGVYRKFGLTTYKVSGGQYSDDISEPYGRDEKFARFDKYIVEGSVDMLDFANSMSQENAQTEQANIQNFKTQLDDFAKDSEGNVYIYQTGSGAITLRNSYSSSTSVNSNTQGETRGGGFGTLTQNSITYAKLVYCPSESCSNTNVYGMYFNYIPNSNFNNRITTGDSGSGIYAFNQKTNQWVLLGVTSQSYTGQNRAYVAAVSNKDLQDYQKNFEQKIDLKITEPNINEWTLTTNNLKYNKRGDTPDKSYTLEKNKDIIFSGNGTMTIQVQENIQLNQDKVGAGGFVFEAASGANADTAANPTIYKFTNSTATTHIFKGSGLDIGENVEVQWALRNESEDSLHKIGLGTLRVQTAYTPSTGENLGTLKIGQGKVILDTATKAYEGIYLTSGRGSLTLVQGKAEGLGASKNTTASVENSVNSYTLAQNSANEMGFYFGTGGGKLDLAGNSLTLNTIAANDSKAIITNSSSDLANLEIQGFGYDFNNSGAKTATKANTIIHASFGESTANSSGNLQNSAANLNLIHKSDTKNDSASLIFDGNINIKGALNATNSSVVLQGHPTTHATISDESIRNQVQAAENGTSGAATLDLSRPSTLAQRDWDSRNFAFGGGINLTNANLSVGKATILNADITADKDSQITFGGTHFIDKKDGANIGGSGFYYAQEIESDTLENENYESSEFSGKITADGSTINSNFANFAPNLELKNSAKLSAKNLILNDKNSINLSTNSSASVQNLTFKGFANSDISSKFTLENGTNFSVQKALGFDNSSLDLDALKAALNAKISLAASLDLSILNGSKISANEFNGAKISVENANFSVKNLSSTSLDISLSNAAMMGVESISANVNLSSDNSSFMSVNSLNLNENFTLKSTNAESIFRVKKLEFDTSKALSAQISNANLLVNESLILQNVGQNLANKTDANADFAKDLLAFDLGANLSLKNAKISVNFAQNLGENKDKISLNNYYTIFSASLENVSFELGGAQILDGIFAQGKLENDRFLVKFMDSNPASFDNLNQHLNPALSPLLEILLQHNKNDESVKNAVNLGDYTTLQNRLTSLEKSLESLANSSEKVLQSLPLLHRQEINARITQNRLEKFAIDELSGTKLAYNGALNRLANPTSRSDIAPRLALWNEKERTNRVWSNVGAGYFAQNGDKLSLYSVSLGYDRRFLGDELLVGGLISLTNADFRAEKLAQSPKIYTIALYSDTILGFGELQNELSGSFISGDMSFEGESADYKGFGAFFDSIYKLNLSTLPIKPKALVRVALQGQNELKSPNYKQKAYQDVSVELGLGLEWLYERKSGFYAASFLARRDVYHSEPSAAVSLANAQDFIVYKRAEPSFAYELQLWGLDKFSNGLFVRYGVGAYLATHGYKGIKADLQVGYKF